MEIDLGFLIFPFCGLVSGAVCWIWFRGDDIDDGALFNAFMVPFAIGVVVLFGFSRSDFVRGKVDPAFRLQRQLDAHPVYNAMKRYEKTEFPQLHQALTAGSKAGIDIPTMFRELRPMFAQLGTHRMGFADANGRVAWARMYVDTLSELQDANPESCFQVLAGLPEGSQALQKKLSATNSRAFEALFAKHLQLTYEAMGSDAKRHASLASTDDARREWNASMEWINNRYGPDITHILTKRRFAAAPPDTHRTVCAARIAQLNLFLDLPEPVAGYLVDSAMR